MVPMTLFDSLHFNLVSIQNALNLHTVDLLSLVICLFINSLHFIVYLYICLLVIIATAGVEVGPIISAQLYEQQL